MWILATLTDVEALEAITRLLPLTVRLADDPSSERFVVLQPPADLTFVEGRGLRVACSGRVTWSLPVGTLEMTMTKALALLVPSIETRGDEAVLRFVIEVEALEFEWVPALVDQKVAELVGQKLCALPVEWNFTKTLTHTFTLPAAVEPPRELATSVREPSCTVTGTAMTLALYVAALPSLAAAPASPE